MSDATTLRNLLRKTDGSAPAIQQTAGAMMKHYDKSPGVAVVEWRNALHQARLDQHLPLLYVANETLQNSKRNRGNKFLEAFSPALGQSLAFMCQNNPDVVEKVRRTVKIWGDRHVFSVRFVNELLKGLESYRGTTATRRSSNASATSSNTRTENHHNNNGSFSPLHGVPSLPTPAVVSKTTTPTATTTASGTISSPIDIDKVMAMDDDDDNNATSGQLLDVDGGETHGNDTDHGDDDDDLFGDTGDRLLNIELDLDVVTAAAAATSGNSHSSHRKRRRPSSTADITATGATPGGTRSNTSKAKRRPVILSTNSLMELWSNVSALQQRYDNTQTLLAGITPEYLDDTEHIDTLVGKELLDQYKNVLVFEKRVVDQRKELHNIAKKRKSLEQEAVRYLPWLESALKQDQDDIEFCDKVVAQIESFRTLHGLAKAAREERLAEEARIQRQKEEQEQMKRDREERKRLMESAVARVTEAKPGMVWNRATGEYQYRQTDEAWRD